MIEIQDRLFLRGDGSHDAGTTGPEAEELCAPKHTRSLGPPESQGYEIRRHSRTDHSFPSRNLAASFISEG